MRLEKESRERMVDSNGRIIELEDDAMLPPPQDGAAAVPTETRTADTSVRASAAATAPEVSKLAPVKTPVLRDTSGRNGKTS